MVATEVKRESNSGLLNPHVLTTAALLLTASFSPALAESRDGYKAETQKASEKTEDKGAGWRFALDVALIAGAIWAFKAVGVTESDFKNAGFKDFEQQLKENPRKIPTL